MKKHIVDVTVLSAEGCVNTPPTIALIEKTAREGGISIRLTRIVVATRREAERQRMHGSPTIRINGLDLDPAASDNWGYTLA